MWIILQYIFFYTAVISTVLFLGIFLYFQFCYTYWGRKGMPYIKPKFPLGNNNTIGLGAISYGIETCDWYKELKLRGLKFGGAWNWCNPVLTIVDPEYAKDILVKDFSSFPDRHFFHNPKHDVRGNSLFVAKNKEWKYMRRNMTPTFTSARMKLLFNGVMECTKQLIQHLESFANNKTDVDIKDVMAAYTIDVIGSTAYGLELQSFKDENSKFRSLGRAMFSVNLLTGLKNIYLRMFEELALITGVGGFPKWIIAEFADMVRETMEFRIKHNVKRDDFMQSVIDLHFATEGKENSFTFDDLVGNIILFFIAGFDTSSTTLNFALYKLAMHPEIQEKAREEINKVTERHEGNLTYDWIQDMTYVRQIVDETLRYFPPVSTLARIATERYRIKDTDVYIEKGTKVVIPVLGYARDPEYFPDPERFDPDRFSLANKSKLNPHTYLPFGDGPRNCIGMRFGLMQTLAGLAMTLKNFKVTLSPTTKPVTLKRGLFVSAPEDKIYLKFEKI